MPVGSVHTNLSVILDIDVTHATRIRIAKERDSSGTVFSIEQNMT